MRRSVEDAAATLQMMTMTPFNQTDCFAARKDGLSWAALHHGEQCKRARKPSSSSSSSWGTIRRIRGRLCAPTTATHLLGVGCSPGQGIHVRHGRAGGGLQKKGRLHLPPTGSGHQASLTGVCHAAGGKCASLCEGGPPHSLLPKSSDRNTMRGVLQPDPTWPIILGPE